MSDQPYEFGSFRIDPVKRELLRDGVPLKLYPKEFDILAALVERHGQVVSKDELLRLVWPDSSVEESNLTTHVSHLRKLLGDSTDARKYIVTLPGRGYQFVAAVTQPRAVVEPRVSRRIGVRAGAAAALAVTVAGLALWSMRNPHGDGPSYRQLTFRQGPIWSARFAPDGRTIVYGAAWDGNPTELFLTRPDSPESQSLGTHADVLAISPRDEIAVSLARHVERLWESSGTLARLPLAGGTPRPILAGVKDADWAADGDRLAVVRRVDGRDRLEFPIGTTLYESPGFIIAPRLSRDGRLVALLERLSGEESVIVIGASGERHALLRGQVGKTGLAWSASGKELFVTIVTGGSTVVHAVTLSSERRIVTEAPGEWKLHDISRDGRALLTRDHTRGHVVVSTAGSPERDLSWHDRSVAVDLSADGTKVLMSEIGAAAGGIRAVYLRSLDGSPAVKLGDGQAQSLSPDGRWALVNQGSAPERLVLLPIGPGEAKPVKNGPIADYFGVRWLPDGKHIAFGGIGPGGELRQYVQDVEGGDPRPAPWRTGVAAAVFLPGGRSFIARGKDNELFTFDVEGGSPQPVAGALAGDYPVAVTADGQSLFVFRNVEGSATIQRIDRATGRRELWRTVVVADRTGIMHTGPEFPPLLLTDDGRTYVYNYVRMLSDLYLVEGLR